MKARDLMTAAPTAVTSMDTVSRAASLMRERNVGCLPVVERLEVPILVGAITDRDITVRCAAQGHPPVCRVREHMSAQPLQTVRADADVSEVLEKMARACVRRIPVVTDDNVLVGIVAQADLATKLAEQAPVQVVSVLERVSAPAVLTA